MHCRSRVLAIALLGAVVGTPFAHAASLTDAQLQTLIRYNRESGHDQELDREVAKLLGLKVGDRNPIVRQVAARVASGGRTVMVAFDQLPGDERYVFAEVAGGASQVVLVDARLHPAAAAIHKDNQPPAIMPAAEVGPALDEMLGLFAKIADRVAGAEKR